MRNIKLVIEYDGSAYHGWQTQINATAVQDVVEKSLGQLAGENIKLIGASRTDVGVHALGQTANFHTSCKIPAEKFSFALNTILPADITIRSSEEVDKAFHSRFCSKGKTYKYFIWNFRQPSALLRNRAWHVPSRLDISKMEQASRLFEGKHDFSAFYRASGSSVASTVRTITGIRLKENITFPGASALSEGEGRILELEISGDGFLYNMVRIISGTLVEVGMGRLGCSEVSAQLDKGERCKAGRTAPAHGLYLVEVYY